MFYMISLLNTITKPEYTLADVEYVIYTLNNSSADFDEVPTNIAKQCISPYIHPLI